VRRVGRLVNLQRGTVNSERRTQNSERRTQNVGTGRPIRPLSIVG
jgi:hypothetical protein